MRRFIICFFGIIALISGAIAQSEEVALLNANSGKKGRLYLAWGYNRAYYNKSDVHFRGEGYDFTLHNVRAEDMREKFDPKVYFNPTQFTVPQFNFRMGYYFGKNTAISAGWDHMKYHIIPTQLVEIDGHIDESISDMPGYTGDFHHDYILYQPKFMDYHHSDGFNFLRLAIEHRLPFLNSKNGKHILAMNGCISAGAFLPWTDFTFFGQRHKNQPHFAGYGASMHAGFRYEFFNYFFLQVMAQVGWSNLVNVMLEDGLPSRADQKITFIERSWAIGFYSPLLKRK